MEQTALQSIIRQAAQGSHDAFREIVGEYQNMVFALCMKMLCREEDAEDAVQETFIRIWKHLPRYDATRTTFSTWIYTIATHICLDRLRQRKRLLPLPGDSDILRRVATESNTERQLENKEWAAIVRLLTPSLSAKQQLVFTLILLEGLSTDEVSAITGMSAEKIKSNLYVARQKIQNQLKLLGYEQ